MKVKELMSTNIACVGEDTPASMIAAQMRKNDIGSIPVCDDSGHIKGIVTDRDLVVRVMARAVSCSGSKDPSNEAPSADAPAEPTASCIMTSDPVTISPEQNIHDAALLFAAHKIRRLPVTEASRIVGMLSLGDIAVKPVYIDEAGDALSAISLSPSV